MYITMHCGGLPFNGDTLKTKSLGGSETAAYYMAKALAALGHNVIMFTNERETGTFDGVKYEWAGEPSQDMPLGDRFTFYAENTPHDVCIIQRHPRAFERKWASKINLWWLHDLALLRNKEQVTGQMWNIDQVLCVSEYHRKQVSDVYGIPQERIAVVRNAVDHALFEPEAAKSGVSAALAADLLANGTLLTKANIIYSSRPERGLIHLVRKGGIMDQLADDDVHLHVCGYDNTTPEMAEFYEMLWARCKQMPNVTLHGSLTKQQLAHLQMTCDALVYPTEFEEVSCITAMEAMAAGIGIISSDFGALPETCDGSAAVLLPLKDGQVGEDLFVEALREHAKSIKARSHLQQLEAAKKFTWDNSADAVLATVRSIFADTAVPSSLAHHFIRHSDIKAFEALKLQPDGSRFVTGLLSEFGLGYAFYRDNTYEDHYRKYYQYEKDRGVNYGPEDVTRTTRFQAVANLIGQLPDGSAVLDYGCAHGHYTVALAHRYPTISFVGADITQSNIDAARKWAADEGLKNIEFVKVSGVAEAGGIVAEDDAPLRKAFDAIIAAEVIEHVGNPQDYTDKLACLLAPTGRMIITTPYGPWEAQGYREHKYWRAHLHHFERADILEAWGHHPDFKILAAPSGLSQFHTPLGSYIFSFGKPKEASREINYLRKTMQTKPDQTVSCCMIVKDAEQDILRCLKSVSPHVQEFIIGLDDTTTDDTKSIILEFARKNPLIEFTLFDMQSPTVQGFDSARNETISKAACDWVLWIDADEVLVNGSAMLRYLRESMYNGFAVKQHHFSHDPAAIIKTDIPCRLFRNRKGIKFFGKVHEHPELVMNDGLGPVMLMPRTEIVHSGYHDEGVRRRRFSRNLPLLAQDRKENPTRILGKFLWLRDLAQSCQYDAEDGTAEEQVFLARAAEGIKLWEELLDAKNYRLVIDALPYYSHLAQIVGNGFDFSFAVDASKFGQSHAEKQPVVAGYFASKEHAFRLMRELAEDKTATFDGRYQ